MTSAQERETRFIKLIKQVKACTSCPRMANSIRVIGPGSGSIDAPILIIGEAPGRLGADASAIPFHGDKAGDNFESLMEQVGLSRHDCFITNAALCNPKDERGNNATPSKIELQNCSNHLRQQIDIVSPGIVVTLGGQALAALKLIEEHNIDLSSGVRKAWQWYGRTLVPMYHPGQRAMIHRSFFNQLADYRFLSETFSRTQKRAVSENAKPTSESVAKIAAELASEPSGISYFALHKLFYLTEYEFYRRTNRRMTSAYIVRQKEGPYVFEMHIKKLKKAISNLEVWNQRSRLMVRCASVENLFHRNAQDEFSDVLRYVREKYAKCSDADLKRIVYLTAPMRQILRSEKGSGQNMFNRAIDFSAINPAE